MQPSTQFLTQPVAISQVCAFLIWWPGCHGAQCQMLYVLRFISFQLSLTKVCRAEGKPFCLCVCNDSPVRQIRTLMCVAVMYRAQAAPPAQIPQRCYSDSSMDQTAAEGAAWQTCTQLPNASFEREAVKWSIFWTGVLWEGEWVFRTCTVNMSQINARKQVNAPAPFVVLSGHLGWCQPVKS